LLCRSAKQGLEQAAPLAAALPLLLTGDLNRQMGQLFHREQAAGPLHQVGHAAMQDQTLGLG
jgi:endonuclease/exonuclease/phosphatase family metal-dependent hydrolase